MKTNLSKTFSFSVSFLAVFILFSFSISVKAQENSISNADIQFLGSNIHVYDGSKWIPDFIVMLNGEDLDPANYDTTYNAGKNVGIYSITISGKGNYTGTATISYEITPYPLSGVTLATSSCDKIYDGNASAYPHLKAISPLVDQESEKEDSITITYDSAKYNSRYVGTEKDIIIDGLGLSGPDKGNYLLPENTITLKNCGSITPVEPQIKTHAELKTGGKSLNLKALVSGYRGDERLNFLMDPVEANGCQLKQGILSSGTETGQARVEVYIDPLDVNSDGTPEYNSGHGYITVTITTDSEDKPNPPTPGDGTQDPDDSKTVPPEEPGDDTDTGSKRQDPLVVTGSSSMVYGEHLDLGVVGGSGSGAVTYAITGGTGSGTIDQNGRLQAARVGTVWVTAYKAGDKTYQMQRSDAKVITVNPAKLTITAANKTIKVGEAAPSLTHTDYKISGLVGNDQLRTLPTLVYASTPDTSKPGTVAIHPVGAEAPAGENYQGDITYIAGRLTIQEVKDFPITIHQAANGTLSASHQSAQEGATVTLTAIAKEGFVPGMPTVTYQGIQLVVADKGNGRYVFSMPGGPVTITASFATKPPNQVDGPTFSDVQASDWFSNSVAFVCQNGLMVGTSQNSFSPNDTTTRGMMVTILYRTDGEPPASNQSHYADVPPSAYYAAPVSWASWYGIASGYTPESFGPEDNLSRQQLATILYRYATYKNFDVSARGNLVQFADRNQISDYAMDALSWANAVGLISGKSDQILDPTASTTRAEMAAILQRFCQKYALF